LNVLKNNRYTLLLMLHTVESNVFLSSRIRLDFMQIISEYLNQVSNLYIFQNFGFCEQVRVIREQSYATPGRRIFGWGYEIFFRDVGGV
jgi:hypothetical protein